MRKYVTPLLFSLVAAVPGAAFAASTATPAPQPAVTSKADQLISGTVKAFDLKAHTLTLTLTDGKIYQLPATFKDPGLKAGEKVTVHWKTNGSAYEATAVNIG